MLADGLNIFAWRGILEVILVSVIFIHVLNHGIEISIVPRSSFVVEISSKKTENVICHIVLDTIVEMVQKILSSLLGIEIF